MNFQALKSMVQSLVQNHKCPDCSSALTDKDVDIIGAAGTTINLDLSCPSCGKHSMIKSEAVSIDLSNIDMNKIKESISGLHKNLSTSSPSEGSIKDEVIVDLNKNLKKEAFNVSDLFGE